MLTAEPLLLLTAAAPEPEEPSSSSSAPDAAPGSDQQQEGLPRSASDADFQPPPGVSWKKSKAAKRKSVKSKDLDYYALLGLKHERWTATESQLKHGGCLGRDTCASPWVAAASALCDCVLGSWKRQDLEAAGHGDTCGSRQNGVEPTRGGTHGHVSADAATEADVHEPSLVNSLQLTMATAAAAFT